MEIHEGLIMCSRSGFYNVKTKEGLVCCKARGSLRYHDHNLLTGDKVTIEQDGQTGMIVARLPRKNALTRPPIANLDRIFLVVSSCDPEVNYLVTDKLTVISQFMKIDPVIVLTKCDLKPVDTIRSIYQKANLPVVCIDYQNWQPQRMLSFMHGYLSAFCGNSGVGKSTLLNHLFPHLNLQSGEISAKLKRGRHTTRTVELFEIKDGYVADTPGFSRVMLSCYPSIPKEKLAGCFSDFQPYLGLCQYNDCSHTTEKGCAILQAVENGEIAVSRHRSYLAMYHETKNDRSRKA